jgi:hypothetical protein
MHVVDFNYPVIAFQKGGGYWIYRDSSSVVTANRTALKKGYLNDLLLVDSDGRAIKIESATKLHGVGPFFGFNIFFQRRIKVELKFKDAPFAVSPDEVRNWVFKSWKEFPIDESAGNFDERKSRIEAASSVAEIIGILAVGWD